jgi:hypothetical protein
MPDYYIEFDEQLSSDAARYKLSKDEFRERVYSYAAQLVQSFCTSDELCTMTKIIIGGFRICMFFDIASHSKTRTKKWVLRVPIPGQHGGDLLDDKFRSEVATMKLVLLY